MITQLIKIQKIIRKQLYQKKAHYKQNLYKQVRLNI